MIPEPLGHAPADSPVPFIEVRRLTKRFPGTLALSGVDLRVHPGEVIAVIGENGAGKSTLMKILAGVLAADEGDIELDGQAARLASVRQATDMGIALIHQELSLLANLSVAANLFLGREPNRAGWMHKSGMHAESVRLLKRVGLEIDPGRLVSTLPIGQRQLVEVARALATDARLLIMDEPTSSLSEQEVETLFGVIGELKAKGVAVLYVSHRLGEVEAIADRVVVLRDGEVTGRLTGREIVRRKMVQCMVGRDIARSHMRMKREFGEVALKVDRLQYGAGRDRVLSVTIREGEIVGLAGLVGSGRSTLLRTLFGIESHSGGSIWINGQPVRPGSPKSAIAAGMGLVPEDRAAQGLVLNMETRPNISLGALHQHLIWKGWLNRPWERQAARTMTSQLGIRGVRDGKLARLLSGGNQQKVVLGKWLLLAPKVLLLDEPTRGIDLAAKREIYQVVEELAGRGMAIMFASSEMEELLALADRVLVMHQWGLAGELAEDELSEESIMHLATGHKARA